MEVLSEDVISSDPILSDSLKPAKKGGWGEETKGKGKRRRDLDTSLTSETEVAEGFGEAIDDIPVIPDMEDLQAEEKLTTISAPPSIAINRVTTFKQLEADLNKQSTMYFMDGKIDLKLLARSLCPEEQIREEEKPWQLDRLLTELQSDFENTEAGSS